MHNANEERQRLYRIAGQINNALRAPIDIVTFCGFLSVDEIKVHLTRYFAQIDADSQRAIVASMKEVL
jgi:hypothetical protein